MGCDTCAKHRSQWRFRGSVPKTDNFKLDAVYASEVAVFNIYKGVMGSITVVEGIIYKKLSLAHRLRTSISFFIVSMVWHTDQIPLRKNTES